MARTTSKKEPKKGSTKKRKPNRADEATIKTLASRCSPKCVALVMDELKKDNDGTKLAEVEEMGFSFLKYIPRWLVNQKMMVALAKSYDRNTHSLNVGTRKIRFKVETVARCFGLPNYGQSFKTAETDEEKGLFVTLQNETQCSLTETVKSCTIKSEEDRIYFRRQFILLICKCFFFPSPRQTIGAKHINAVIDVSEPKKIYWARYIYDDIIKEVMEFQDKGKKTIDGCMYALLIIYLMSNLHGDLETYSGEEPWVKEWPVKKLAKNVKDEANSPSGLLNYILTAPTNNDNEGKKKGQNSNSGTKSHRNSTRKGADLKKDKCNKNKNDKTPSKIPVTSRAPCTSRSNKSQGLEPTHVKTPTATRKRTRSSTKLELGKKQRFEDNTTNETKDTEMRGSDFKPEFISSDRNDVNNLRETETIDRNTPEHTIVSYIPPVEPIQVDCSAPSFSLGVTQQESTKTKFHSPETKEKGDANQEHDTIGRPEGDDVDKVYHWATGSRITESFTLAWITNGDYISLKRSDMIGMRPRGKVSDAVVDYFCAMFNVSNQNRFKEKFYCFSPRVMAIILTEENIKHYMESKQGYLPTLTKNLAGKKCFNAELALNRDYWFVPVCLDDHWWLYLLDKNSEQLWVLDSIHAGPYNQRRLKVDEYVGLLLKELAVSIQENTPYSGERFICSYEARIPKQPNTHDCGIYVIKWMQMFDPKCKDEPLMPKWDTKQLLQIRKELVVDMLFSKDNDVNNLRETETIDRQVGRTGVNTKYKK